MATEIQFPGTIEAIEQLRVNETMLRQRAAADLGAGPPVQEPVTATMSGRIEVSEYRFEPFMGLDNLVDVWHLIYPHKRLYPWQYQELMRLSGYLDGTRNGPRVHWTPEAPFMSNYVCCNDAGKDMVIITTLAIGLPLLYRNVIVVITSSSWTQLKQQTQVHIERAIKALNERCGNRIFNSIDFFHSCPERGGEIHMFTTDEPGRAEGWHPRDIGGRLVMIKNEDKTIPEPIQIALERCHGFSHWVNISSPGPRRGKFYRTYLISEMYPKRPQPFRWWARKVDWTQCPHITPQYFEMKVAEHGVNSFFIKTSFLAEFSEQEEDVVVPQELILRAKELHFKPDILDIGIGNDAAAGGDETATWVRFGSVPTRKLFFRDTDTKRGAQRVHEFLVDLREHEKFGAHISFNLDDNGISRTYSDTLERLKWRLQRRVNQSSAYNKAKFINLGAEMAWHTRILFERGQIMAPNDADTELQLATRSYDATKHNGKISLLSKRELKSIGSRSPDRADAWNLCFFSFRPHKFFDPLPEGTPDEHQTGLISIEELAERMARDPYYLDRIAHANRPGPKHANHTLLCTNAIQ